MEALKATLLFVASSAAVLLRQQHTPTARGLRYVSFGDAQPQSTLVVDCTHPSCRQLTHHLKLEKQRELHLDVGTLGADSTTEQLVKAATLTSFLCPLRGSPFTTVSSNHFDVDSFLSVWVACNPTEALVHKDLLTKAATIGDFRELRLSKDDGTADEVSFKALAIVCWLNSEERRLFYRPFEGKISRAMGEGEEGDLKFHHFLPLLGGVLDDPMKVEDQWKEEYGRVVEEYFLLHQDTATRIERHDDISAVVVRSKQPLHYYSLFSASIGLDTVISLHEGQRYEVELKYTGYIDLKSRPTLPRVEIERLSNRLNELEKAPGVTWHANRINDSGPLLRLETDRHLTKAERYGHPFERPIYSSSLSEKQFCDIVLSYFRHAYKFSGVTPQNDWTWQAYTSFNKAIDWDAWTSA